MTYKREMELAGEMDEMISLGWTLDTFDQDFDNCETDAWTEDEKEVCRKVFTYLLVERHLPVIKTGDIVVLVPDYDRLYVVTKIDYEEGMVHIKDCYEEEIQPMAWVRRATADEIVEGLRNIIEGR